MSFDNAISARAKMNTVYRQMLEEENSLERKNAIEQQIKLNLEEIESLRKEQVKIFGKPSPLVQETKIIEPDHETKSGQKVTVLNGPSIKAEPKSDTPKISQASEPKSTRLENSLRAKIQAAKAAKKA